MAPLPSVQTIGKVLEVAIRVAGHSWEYGTVSDALLAWHNPELTIWNNPFPNGHTVPKLNVNSIQALTYVKPQINAWGKNLNWNQNDGSAADPASMGIASFMIGQSRDSDYYKAAARQSNELLNNVPRWPNGAISHRYKEANLWADFVYMAPPFLAYHGVVTDNVGLLKKAANQCKLYKDVLKSDKGPWRHITGPEAKDTGLWSTGNAWAVAGMSRVLATMRKSWFDSQTKGEQAMLTGMIKEIIDGVMKLDKDIGHSSGLLRNYLHDTYWFGEVSGTSLIAATIFRMAVLEPGTFGSKYTSWAETKMGIVDSKINKDDGYVGPAVDPLNWGNTKPFWGSPEGQAFVVLMHAAYRDWKN